MRLVKRALMVCLGLIISFIGLIAYNIPLGGSEESAVAVDWYAGSISDGVYSDALD